MPAECQKNEKKRTCSNSVRVVWMYHNTCGSATYKTLSLSLSHEASFRLRVRLPLYLLWESLPPPSGPLARRFFSFSVMNHTCTCTHMQTHTFAFTHSHKLPSTLDSQSQLLPPPGHHSSPSLGFFFKSFFSGNPFRPGTSLQTLKSKEKRLPK